MWNRPGPHLAIHPSQLVEGLYVWLDVPWDEHPFLTSRILLKTAEEVATVQSMDWAGRLSGRLYYHPEKSSRQPLPAPPVVDIQAQVEAAVSAEVQRRLEAMAAQEREKKEKLHRQRALAQQADRAWEDAARRTKQALVTLNRSPKSAGELLAQLSRETAAAIVGSKEVILHLLGDKKDQGAHFHALSVLTMAMLLGKKVGLGEGELADLALAALAHDAGKVQIPLPVLRNPQRKKHEEDFFRQHVLFSCQLARESGAFTDAAIGMMADHHELADGSGWPRARSQVSRGAQILALVNRYDNLCMPEQEGISAIMPAEALARMFRLEAKHYNPELLGLFIKLLGV